ncbi:MAG: hypothetical protein ACRDZR_04275 [Acidimicrobiales bacterium]
MPEEQDPRPQEGSPAPVAGDRPPVESGGLSMDERLSLLASYVQPDGRLRVPGLVVPDDEGNERIVLGVEDRRASVAVRVSPTWSPTGTTEAAIFAQEGDDEDLYAYPPSVGFDVTAGGNVVAALSADLTTGRGVMGAGHPDLHFSPWFSPDP